MQIDTSKSIAITKLMAQSGWNQIRGMMFYSYMRKDDDPEPSTQRNDSERFEDAIEPPDEPVRSSSRFRCFRRKPRERGAERPQGGRSYERSVRDGSSQTPEPRPTRTIGSNAVPSTRNSQTATIPRTLSRQRGVSRTNIERTPRRDNGTAMVPRNLIRQRGISGIDIPRTPRRAAESQAAPESRATGSQADTLPRPHFPMGQGGIGTADQPPQAPSAPEFGQLHQGGWPLTLPPEPGS